jgi:cysteine desulfurase
MDRIYLDHNATTPLDQRVQQAMIEAQLRAPGNPSSQHAEGRLARRLLDDACEEIGQLLGTELATTAADRVILTSGGTEANNLALFGMAGLLERERPGHAIVSSIEHPSVLRAADMLRSHGWQIDHLGVDSQGVVHVGDLPRLMRDDTRFVSVMLGNNETGALQPIAELAEITRTAGVALHTDASQVVGKLPVDFRALGVDALSLAGHKFHGPRGIGALVVRQGVSLHPAMAGGPQQLALRPGTEPLGLVVGLQTALRLAQVDQPDRARRLAGLRDRLEARLLADWPALVVNSRQAPRVPQTLSVAFVGLDRQALVMALDMAGVACSTGSACSSGSSEPSTTLRAMGLEEPIVQGSLRFSVGAPTTASEVDLAADRILKVANDLSR